MRKTKLPIMISVPHGGHKVPRKYRGIFIPSRQEVLKDGDTWTRDLYRFKGRVRYSMQCSVARAVLDLNRVKEDRPPENPDGIIKTHTLFETPVWKHSLSDQSTEQLIQKVYDPYYDRLLRFAADPLLKLGIDCHSMMEDDPFDKDADKRPLFCISNLGGLNGEYVGEPLSAPTEMLVRLKHTLESVFGEGCVLLNAPFKGGAIIKTMRDKSRIPWIQLEINRKLYLDESVRITKRPRGKAKRVVSTLNQSLYECFMKLGLEETVEPTLKKQPEGM